MILNNSVSLNNFDDNEPRVVDPWLPKERGEVQVSRKSVCCGAPNSIHTFQQVQEFSGIPDLIQKVDLFNVLWTFESVGHLMYNK